jgi:hypothetical protein
MSTIVEITESAKPALRRLKLGLKHGAANGAVGRAVVKLVRNHFLALPPNKRGMPTTHFWRRAAKATTSQADRDSVHIRINQVGVSQRLLGGPIDPVRVEFLTIPAIAESYGHRAGDFNSLKVVRGSFKMYTGRIVSLALAPEDWKPNPANPGDSSGVFFWLVRHVTQDPDPTVLPSRRKIRHAALAALKEFYR